MAENCVFDPKSIAERVSALLTPISPSFLVDVKAETESTNADLLELDYQAHSPSCLLLALKQSHGRGRQGRPWLSDEGSLTFSVRWQFKRSAAALNGLPLAVAVAALNGLESIGVQDLSIKWPNDLLKGKGKLGGILLELGKPISDGMTNAVIGIGINLQPPFELSQFDHPCAAIHESTRAEDIANIRENTLVAILKSLIPALIKFDTEGFHAFRQEWMGHAAWLGQKVELSTGTQGTLIGVDQDGALLLDTDLCIERFLSGDLSLRHAERTRFFSSRDV
jgi:BirA family biotin operon repressor/biotin-[acetyl-CoA-carboxylase] ligase